MDDLERIRQQKLRDLQERQAAMEEQSVAAEQAAAEQDAAIDRLLQQVLTPEARERLSRIRLARPDFAQAVTHQLVTLAQSGRLTRRLGDEELRAVLAQLTPQTRDINITRK